ncbi:MAG TPA: GNAT family N-acetyltransferase [Pyrinomonadaceae bacterium]|nr:GNAT family N-acetyltransferase [Pyrinomonadaceae bacterium]
MSILFSDKELSIRLERAEARFNASFVESRARLFPETGAAWMDAGGVYAMYDGPDSPCTQAFGLGLFSEPSDEVMDQIEAFFAERNAPVLHEVSPMAEPLTLELLNRRGYGPIELTSVMARRLESEIARSANSPSRIDARLIEPGEEEVWAEVSAAGWLAEMPELEDFFHGLGRTTVASEGASPFLALLDGHPIAAAMLLIVDDVSLLAGASTMPEARRTGAQAALLDARLRFAADRGCTVASMGAAPGSQSQKNGQKNGFDIIYTRTKWQRMR